MKPRFANALILKLGPGSQLRPRLRALLAVSALALAMAGVTTQSVAQGAAHAAGAATNPTANSGASGKATESKHPSNAQLADPKIEARVERLLRQMTLDESSSSTTIRAMHRLPRNLDRRRRRPRSTNWLRSILKPRPR